MKNKLDEIISFKKGEVERQKSIVSFKELLGRVSETADPLDFTASLGTEPDTISCIAEIKKASPSKGVIAKNISIERTAREYKQGGASALSVLTDEKYFQGKPEYVDAAKGASHLPILRKDFIVDEYQIYESRAIGADAILLIAATLTDQQLRSYLATARDVFLSVLVECHSKEEIERSLDGGAEMIGINNRDLQTFDVDVSLSLNLKRFIPNHIISVSESGIKNFNTVERLSQAGFDAILVGEHLMVQTDKSAALRELLGKNIPV